MRVYSSIGYEYRDLLISASHQKRPVVVFSIQTTDINPLNAEIVQFVAQKCIVRENCTLEPVSDKLSLWIKPSCSLSAFTLRWLDKPASFFDDKPSFSQVAGKIKKFIGKYPVLINYMASEFASKILLRHLTMTGYVVHPHLNINLYDLTKSICYVDKNKESLKFVDALSRFGVQIHNSHDSDCIVDATIALFNKVVGIMPTGTHAIRVNKIFYTKINFYNQYLTLETDRGTITLNCITNYWQENTDGLFDYIDMEWLTTWFISVNHTERLTDAIAKYCAKEPTGFLPETKIA
ncbi:hypothetical protein SAMN05216391_11955 [Lachnospiraceae bacterium KHCPX20]|nr:hypothetical protein SAMN05216391_11955 [Lachnospiraceae bacterium KHCPX20]